MQTKRLNVSPGAGGVVMIKRNRFDSHIDTCDTCTLAGVICPLAQTLWRQTVLAAMKTQGVTS